MQPQLLLLLLLPPSFPVILARGEAQPGVKGWRRIPPEEMLGEVREHSQVPDSEGTLEGAESVPSSGDSLQGALTCLLGSW